MRRGFLWRAAPLLFSIFAVSNVSAVQPAGQVARPQPSQATAESSDIIGNWHFTYKTDGGDREMDATFKVDGDQVTGKYGTADVKGTYKDGDLNLAFPFDSEEANMKATLKMKGKMKDGKLVGTWEFADYNGDFTALRAK
ncbi:MAG: hypothetical protein M3Y24_02855 [Acidobacteriota bacterium]|nr:hypothetical protein [Acidobacteriota bacterium]